MYFKGHDVGRKEWTGAQSHYNEVSHIYIIYYKVHY